MKCTYEILFMNSTNMNVTVAVCMRKKISCNTSKVKLLNFKYPVCFACFSGI